MAAVGVGVDEGDFGGGSALTFDGDAGGEAAEIFFVGDAGDGDLVFLLDAVAGVGEAEGEVAVAGEEDEAGGVFIEAADGSKVAQGWGQELGDDGTTALVGGGGDVALGFVEDDGDFFGGSDDVAVYGDDLAFIDLGAEFGDEFSVHGDAAFENHLFGFAATGDAAAGDVFVKAHGGGQFRSVVGCRWGGGDAFGVVFGVRGADRPGEGRVRR